MADLDQTNMLKMLRWNNHMQIKSVMPPLVKMEMKNTIILWEKAGKHTFIQ